MLVNIKKRKERAKKKRAAATAEDDDDEVGRRLILNLPHLLISHTETRSVSQQPSAKPATGDAFEDVLYGSESELDDSDEEGEAPQRAAAAGKQRKGGDYAARLRVDDDEPMDLLAGAATRITSKRFHFPSQCHVMCRDLY